MDLPSISCRPSAQEAAAPRATEHFLGQPGFEFTCTLAEGTLLTLTVCPNFGVHHTPFKSAENTALTVPGALSKLMPLFGVFGILAFRPIDKGKDCKIKTYRSNQRIYSLKIFFCLGMNYLIGETKLLRN